MENQNTTGTATEQQQEKTFTQDDVNRIVQERLAKEKAKNNGDTDLAKREQELNRREMTIRAKEILSEKGLPKELAEVMRYEDEDSLNKAIGIIENMKGFKKEEQREYMVLGNNRLPESNGDFGTLDPIKEAFQKKG